MVFFSEQGPQGPPKCSQRPREALRNPDFVKYAESFGAVGYRVHAADELKPILEEAFSSAKPVVIDCPVDYSETINLMDRLGKLICPI